MIVTSPTALAIAAIISAGTILIAWRRRLTLPASTILLSILALILLTLACGDPAWRSASKRRIVAMIDVSQSTRGAWYYANHNLTNRLAELCGTHPYELYHFAGPVILREPVDAPIIEIPVDKTVFAPPPADAILLFSDAQFDLPAFAPPTYVIVDPNLEATGDARISRLELRDKTIAASVDNSGAAREFAWLGANRAPTTVPTGSIVEILPDRGDTTEIRAQLAPADHWPENDALAIQPSPPLNSARWWVGAGDPGAGWKRLSPADLPTDAAAYLAPSVVVLNNISAGEFSKPQLDRVEQYVRDLGGAMVIIGGDHAFAAGDYPGTALETISPLASTPPDPSTRWILLADSSGSMSAAVGDRTRWQIARQALLDAIRYLPPADPVSAGSFARDLNWWTNDIPARQAAGAARQRADEQRPSGPTNLQPALQKIAAQSDGSMPTELLILTDAQAVIDDPQAVAKLLSSRRIRLSILALADFPKDSPIAKIVAGTAGKLITEPDAGKWASRTKQLVQAAQPDHLDRAPLRVQFDGALNALAGRTISLSNQTWPKVDVNELARAGSHMMAARWRTGAGEVAASGFSLTTGEAQAMADLIARPPRDPRFAITVVPGESLRIRIDAIENQNYLNGLALRARLGSEADKRIPQTAPGRYQLELPAPRDPTYVTILGGDNRVLDRTAIAGRYAPEFNAIGNNRARMHELAQRTGGAVIEPSQRSPIVLLPPIDRSPATSQLAIAGAACMTLALIFWKRAGAPG